MKRFILAFSIICTCVFLGKSAPAGTYRDIYGDGMIEISPNGKAIYMWIGGYSVGGMTILEEEEISDGRVKFSVRDQDTTYENCYYWIDDNGDVVMKIAKRTFKMSGSDTNRSEMKKRLQRGW